MLSRFAFSSFAASLVLLSRPAHAQQSRAAAANRTGAPLEPVLPPSDDADDLAILSPSSSQTLFWGGASTWTLDKRYDGNDAILVNAVFDFLHPSVPLDHSSSIADVFCSNGDTMTGTFSSESAYEFSKEVWTNSSNVLFISSADGCGDGNDNSHFLAQDIYFSDDGLSFTAVGRQHSVQDVASQATFTWGNTSPGQLKKRNDANLAKRITPCGGDCPYSNTGGYSADFKVADHADVWPIDANAPSSWSNANQLFSGQGLTVDCVDCSVHTDFQVTGSVTLNFLQNIVINAQISLSGNLYANFLLGITSTGAVQRTLPTQDPYSTGIDLGSLNLPGGLPFTVIDLTFLVDPQATINMGAAGQLLVGASWTQPNFQAMIDLLDPESSYVYAIGSPPTIQPRIEIGTPLDANVVMDLPIGLRFDMDDTFYYFWSNDYSLLTTTPSVTATISSAGHSCPSGFNEYSMDFDNTVDVNVAGDPDFIMMRNTNQVPGRGGCLATTSDPTTPSDPTDPGMTCVNNLPFGTPPAGTSCGLKGYWKPPYQPPRIGKPRVNVATALSCATLCDQTTDCLSMMYVASKRNCFLYSAKLADIPLVIPKRPDAIHQWWDISCWDPCFG